ncbi:MAG: hypothetical protein Q9P01_16180 [Anaerolineae bacterium]|nr:hypothetical protein [Anaerolineae bacterium]MDQ7036307.1 hypothetical protein [Anaerolineae bacterium]
MTQLPLISNSIDNDNTPLPLIVAKRWNFPLAHIQTENGMVYAVQDWMRGLTGQKDIRNLWSMFKKTDAGKRMSNSIVRLPYTTSNGRVHKRDHVDDKGLYLIAQYMRVKRDRPMLDEVRRFLASAGAFVDEVRREPDKLAKTMKDADKLLDAFIDYHRKRGKNDRWIQMRIDSKIKRNKFTAALSEFVIDVLTPYHYAVATDDVYRGLWGRTAANLKKELQLTKRKNLRDHQPTIALHYQSIAEEVCAQKLGQRQELTWQEARDIICTIAKIIGRQAQETSELLNMDLATGKQLLPEA